ncbi:MarR family transcriptional regulator [Streptomyces sp. NPDC049585]|uniref:MarR family winged helix-turn-helix transcriptional regulator n=1 Tax=Streptomyces sp. NPDC049585 TaxID=3155154 RepID=UPI0034384264
MPHRNDTGEAPRTPSPAELEVIALVPQLEPFFRKSVVHDQMPPMLLEAMESGGLTARHGAVLPHLLAGVPLTVGEIAGRLKVSLPTASELVGALSRAGIVRRAEDPANRRRVLVTLAEEYRGAVETFLGRRMEPLLRVLDELGAQERAGFLAGMEAWVRAVRSAP